MDSVKIIAKNLSVSENEVIEVVEELIKVGILQPIKGSNSDYKVADILFDPGVASRLCHILPALKPFAKPSKHSPST